MRATCINMIYELAQIYSRVMFIGSDLRPGLLDGMRKDFPRRWLMEGVSEQHIIGFAAGLAKEGFMPFINTIGTFLTRRCYDQIAIDVCLHDLPVRLIGSGGGFVYAPLGPTHQAIDDIALMRAIPNMTVVAPADADEMRQMMRQTLDYPHPIYIRLGKGGEEKVTANEPFFFGRAVPLRDQVPISVGRSETGPTVLFVTTGVMGARALKAAEFIEQERHIPCEVLHMPTIKPFDHMYFTAYASRAWLIVTVEDHSVIGGLGSAVNDSLATQFSGRTQFPQVLNLGIPDVFAHEYGSQEDLLKAFGLQPLQIAAKVCDMLEAA